MKTTIFSLQYTVSRTQHTPHTTQHHAANRFTTQPRVRGSQHNSREFVQHLSQVQRITFTQHSHRKLPEADLSNTRQKIHRPRQAAESQQKQLLISAAVNLSNAIDVVGGSVCGSGIGGSNDPSRGKMTAHGFFNTTQQAIHTPVVIQRSSTVPWQGRQLLQIALYRRKERLYPRNGTRHVRAKGTQQESPNTRITDHSKCQRIYNQQQIVSDPFHLRHSSAIVTMS